MTIKEGLKEKIIFTVLFATSTTLINPHTHTSPLIPKISKIEQRFPHTNNKNDKTKSPTTTQDSIPVKGPSPDSTKQSLKESIKQKLIQETNRYIRKKIPKSELNGKTLVETCIRHNFNLMFAIAQGTIESGLGSHGSARRTNSVWNVGSFDGQRPRNKYGHPDHSCEPYILLVKRKYMGGKKNEHDLMRNYTSLRGHRYASSKQYEARLKAEYKRLKHTKLGKLYDKYIKITKGVF